MGGRGSGRRHQPDPAKVPVEQCLSLVIADFRPLGLRSGTFVWTWPTGRQAMVGYSLTFDGGWLLTLTYGFRDGTKMCTEIPLQWTAVSLGGDRPWFTCPLCNGRVGRLCLPPGARDFACRRCHNLTYRSSQEAHQIERVCAGLGVAPRVARLIAFGRGRKRIP
jgi:hypothetical protein